MAAQGCRKRQEHDMMTPAITGGTAVNTEGAIQAIKAGKAHGHALWQIILDASERDAYALKPEVWEGVGEYQWVHFADGTNIYVKVPGYYESLGLGFPGFGFPIEHCT
jgi:hypothetical protein